MSALTGKPQVTRFPDGQGSHARRWISDVSELCKARITLMVLVTTLVGFLFGWHGPLDLLYLFQTLGGTALAASGLLHSTRFLKSSSTVACAGRETGRCRDVA